MQASNTFREENRAFSNYEVVREIRAIIELGIQQAVEARSPVSPRIGRKPSAATERTNQPIKVSITYCAACGYEPQTLALASALMYEFVHELASIELIPWQSGAFDVVINGELAHSMYRDGGFPEPAAIVERVREALGAPAQ
jgi:selenoprotein W-related protein